MDEEEIPENLQHKQPGVGHFLVYFYGSADYSWTHKGRTIPFNGKHDMPRKGGVKSDAYAEGLFCVIPRSSIVVVCCIVYLRILQR